MKRFILPAILLAATILTEPARANGGYYVAGDFNGWNPAGLAMTDVGGGYWEVELPTNVEPGRHEFKVTKGSWDVNFPNSNSWFYKRPVPKGPIDTPLKVTFDSNTYNDDWWGKSNLIIVNDGITDWTAVGDWQGWNNGNPATKMVEVSPGVFMYEAVLAPGTYWYKAVKTGTWDAIGADNRAINADSLQFTVNPGDATTQFYVNTSWSAIRVGPGGPGEIPEPSTLLLALSGLAGLGGLRLRKR
ncbi:MAG: PEP-CTERM sorting domain-containing protein [Armatimonadetes bacterium]|jgi:hypothetical protein|nr:PEP-CTERM sorting domain-containing protein [Armatimonadota bacterium]